MTHVRTGSFAALHVVGSSLALTLLAWCLLPPAASGEPVRVPGTSVRIEPPAGFVPAERFPGFRHAEAQASIQVNVLAGPVSQARKGMTKEGLATRGMTLLASSTQQVNGKSALVLHAEQTAEGTAYEKWLVVAGDETSTVVLVGTAPKAADERLRAALKASLLGATWDAAAPADLFEGLPFRLEPAGTLTDVRRLGGNVMLAEPGRAGRAGAGDPIYIAGVSISPVDLSDVPAFSRQRVGQTTGVRDLTNLRGRDIEVAGRPAHEILADAKDSGTAAPILLYQVVVPDGDGYWLVQGIVAAERSPEWLPRFRRITESIRRQPSDATAPDAAPDREGTGPKPGPSGK